jgi:hypothetical protein
MNQWKYLMHPNSKGEYVTINENDGRIVVCKRTGAHLPIPSKTSVSQVRYMMFKGNKIDQWFLKLFKSWESDFARNNPDKYNELINIAF